MQRLDGPPSRAAYAWLVVVLGALTALGPLSNDAYLPSWPQLSADLGASASAVQLSLTACLVGLGFGQVIAGPISDALGRKVPLLAGLALYVVTSVLCAVAPDVWTLVGLRLLQGIGGATGIVIAAAIGRDKYNGADAARLFAALMLVTGIAPVLAPVGGAQLLRFMEWPGIFIALAACGALMLLAVGFGFRESLPAERRQTGGLAATPRVFAGLLGDRRFLGYTLAAGFAFGAMFAYIAGSPFVLQELHGMSPQMFSAVFAVNALGLVIAAQVSGRIVHKTGPLRLLRIGTASSAVGGVVVLAGVLADAGLPVLLAGIFVVVSAVGLVMPNSMALALADNGDNAGAAASLIGLATHLFGGLAAPFAGVAGAANALPMAASIAALAVAGFASLAVLSRTGPAVAADAPVAASR
ncbi:multidrug effflux MFS transporter [Glycomyces niveus]|jgi:DHA1 family bicyclomycin/chloramphenicol resistance-like MFS transporter|uniref:Multidrug effflux MFS transporter n=1 Tax=Glycomyces niveus TaxID=2820287 RepID=A0ABS3TZZ0_9ACTN|nr:multidrug effflux MFS transporter [Glycomyces sp. NEAU-S30]MBO3732087.1 multidrug effflux MFS transporter [Glycomyces sp. NEAU-S30]